MLELMRRGQRWIMAAVIVGVGFVFVVFVGSGNPGRARDEAVVVAVGDRSFGPRDVDRIRRQQEEEYRRLLGKDFDASGAADQLDTLAANILVNQAVLADEAERLGLVVSDSELRDWVRANVSWAVDENGRLRADALQQFAESEYGSERQFGEFLRMDLLAGELRDVFSESLGASRVEAREALLHQQESVRIAYVAVDLETPRQPAEITDADVDALLASDESRVRDVYARRLDDYERAAAVRVDHIPFQAEAEAEAALSRIREGADFADVSLELGGSDLGWVERGGELDPVLEEAAFSLEPGQVSEVLTTESGFHLLRVPERREASTLPFEEVRRDLARELLTQDAAEAEARETARALAEAVASGESLVDAARERGLTLERPDPLHRRPDGYVPGLGVAPDLLATAFALDVGSPGSDRIFEVGKRLVLIQLLEKTRPADEEIEAQIAEERERLARSRRTELAQLWLDERRGELAESGELHYDLTLLR